MTKKAYLPQQVKLYLLLPFIACLSAPAVSNAQITHALTLEKSIEIAKEKSYDILMLKEDLKMAEYNLQAATRRLKTHIDLSLTIPQYIETVRQWEDSTGVSFYPVQQLGVSGGLTINQPLLTDGNIFIETGASVLDDYRTDLRTNNLNTRIGFRQPLDAFYGYNNIKSTLKRAELAYEQSSKSLKREELSLVYDVSSSFYNLLSLQKRTDIASLDLERQTEAYDISKNKYEAGLIREVDALQMEVDLAEAQNSYDIAVLNQVSAINSFKEILGISLQDSVVLDTELVYTIVVVDPDFAVKKALENRLEIREREIQIELQKLNVKQQKAEGMIKSSINAHYERIGVGRQNRRLGYWDSFNPVYNDLLDRPASFGVGFTISIPILDWGENRSRVKASQSRLKQNILQKESEERRIETEVRNLVTSLNTDMKRLQLLEKNVAVAEKSFEITRQRFSDGDIDSQALALERNRLNNAYTNHLNAYIKYQLSLADLLRKTFHDFQRGLAE